MPLIPGYLSYVSGVSMDDLEAGASGHSQVVLRQSLLFVLGFALVFVALGASASTIGALLAEHRAVLNVISGFFIVVMGLTLVGVLRLPALAREYRVLPGGPPQGMLGATLLGSAFAFAWIPCIGPILASILLYAGALATVKAGALLLFVYALGLGVPFILTGLAFTHAMTAFRGLRRFSRPIETMSGLALTAVGVLMLANKMFYVSIWAQRVFGRLGLNLWRYF